MQPMLLHRATEPLPFYINGRYYCEQKLDGQRMVILISNGVINGLGRDGQVVNVPDSIAYNFEHIAFTTPAQVQVEDTLKRRVEEVETYPSWEFDGELVNGTYWMFDMPMMNGLPLKRSPYRVRRDVLERLFGKWSPVNIELAPSAKPGKAAQAMFDRCEQENAEGVVFKHADSKYMYDTRSKSDLKWKFTETVDAVIRGTYRQGKQQSITVGLLKPDGTWTDTGCKIPMELVDKLEVDQVVEIQYLYSVDGEAMFQPQFKGVRTDKAPEECTVDQLKITNKDVLT